MAAALCKSVPMNYALKIGIGLSDYWLLENYVPNIVKVYCKEVAIILALPLMWYVFR